MKFTIGFEKEDTERLYKHWGKIIDSQQWSEGKFTKLFEEKWSDYNQRQSVAFSSWGGAALAALEFFKVSGRTVLCPSNTFMATPLRGVFLLCHEDNIHRRRRDVGYQQHGSDRVRQGIQELWKV